MNYFLMIQKFQISAISIPIIDDEDEKRTFAVALDVYILRKRE